MPGIQNSSNTQCGGGYWGILKTAKNGEKTKPPLGQNRKPHLLSKQENPKTTLDIKTEKPLLCSTKTENRKPDVKKQKVCKPQRTPKPKNRIKSFGTNTEKLI